MRFVAATDAPLTRLEGYSLVIPSLSVGNVGQLAVDILLATLRPKLVAAIDHPALLPVVGSDPLEQNSDLLMTAGEVFKCDKTKLVLVQVRSSVSKAGKASFVDDLLGWAVTSGLDKVVVLSSLAADERVDCQMAAAFRFLTNHKCQAIKEALLQTGMDLKELERKNTFPSTIPGQTEVAGDGLFLPGGGLTKSIHMKSLELDIPVVCLLTFASEGDNSGDALRMVAVMDKWLDIVPKRSDRPDIKFPISWEHMFGNPAPPRIY